MEINGYFTKEEKEDFLKIKGYSSKKVTLWSIDRFDDVIEDGVVELYFKGEEIPDSMHSNHSSKYELNFIFEMEFMRSLLESIKKLTLS